MRRLAALACTSVLLLAACGDTGTPGGGTDRGVDTEDLDPTPQGEGVDAGSGDEPYQCVEVSPAAGGEYLVGDAGSAQVTREDEELVLGEVRENDGWASEVAEESAERIEVRFVPQEEGDMEIALVVMDTADIREREGEPLVEICTRVN